MVTTALLSAIRRGGLGGNWLAAFQAIERRFGIRHRGADDGLGFHYEGAPGAANLRGALDTGYQAG